VTDTWARDSSVFIAVWRLQIFFRVGLPELKNIFIELEWARAIRVLGTALLSDYSCLSFVVSSCVAECW